MSDAEISRLQRLVKQGDKEAEEKLDLVLMRLGDEAAALRQRVRELRRLAPKKLRPYVTNRGLEAYAWPGGYPIVYFDRSGDEYCPRCAEEAILAEDKASMPKFADVHWEGPPIVCGCGEEIESAYGDPDAHDEDDEPDEADDQEATEDDDD